MSKVSILMNGYNAQEYLKEAIDSIYVQTFQDWEIIFIDNCSTDDTKKIVDSYDERIKYYKTEKTIPLGAARNYGIQYCNGEYVAFLDTDDIWLENKLKTQIRMMDDNENFQMCYGGVIYINETSKEINSFIPNATNGNVFPTQLERYEINMQSVVIRNNIKLLFDETKQFSPDFELFMKIAAEYQIGVIKEHLVKYRKLTNSLTSQKIDRWWLEMKQTLDSIFENNSELKDKYSKEYIMAYAKVAYYKAQYFISINEKNKASIELSYYKFVNYKYFVLYIASILPVRVWNFIHVFK